MDVLGRRKAASGLGLNCWDNAPKESFYVTLKGEFVDQRDYLSRGEARADVFQYLEGGTTDNAFISR